MISLYLHSIYSAFIFFPILALVFTLPYLLYQYRKYGSLVIFRGVVVYSFILYLLCIYFLVILPLPTMAEAANSTAPIIQMQPLNCLREVLAIEGFSPLQVGTYGLALRDGEFWQVLFNMALFFPFGIYLRYYFKRNWFETILLSFALSLFFEITQLTALYGIYPRPYRLFDVDDLLLNTMGGLIGHIFAPLFYWILPKKEDLDEISYKRGEKISIFRRLIAAGVDWLIIGGVAILLAKLLNIAEVLILTWQTVALYVFLVGIYFIILPWLCGGGTIGKSIVKLKIASSKGGKATLAQLAIRYGMLYGLFVPSLYLAIELNKYSYTTTYSWLITFIVGIFAVIFFIFALQSIMSMFKNNRELLHEKYSKTKTVSLIESKYN